MTTAGGSSGSSGAGGSAVHDDAWLGRELAKVLGAEGWEPFVVEGLVDSISASSGRQEVDELIENFTGGNAAAIRVVDQYFRWRTATATAAAGAHLGDGWRALPRGESTDLRYTSTAAAAGSGSGAGSGSQGSAGTGGGGSGAAAATATTSAGVAGGGVSGSGHPGSSSSSGGHGKVVTGSAAGAADANGKVLGMFKQGGRLKPTAGAKDNSAVASIPMGPERKVVNCLSCGKVYDCRNSANADIRAFLAGGGHCTFCGNAVSLTFRDAAAQQQVQAEQDRARAAAGDAAAAMAAAAATAAVELKDRLVDYDRNSAKRTAVVDDQSDFFEIDTNAWLSDQERAQLRARRKLEEEAEEARKKRVTITLDLIGRKVIIDNPDSQLLSGAKLGAGSNGLGGKDTGSGGARDQGVDGLGGESGPTANLMTARPEATAAELSRAVEALRDMRIAINPNLNTTRPLFTPTTTKSTSKAVAGGRTAAAAQPPQPPGAAAAAGAVHPGHRPHAQQAPSAAAAAAGTAGTAGLHGAGGGSGGALISAALQAAVGRSGGGGVKGKAAGGVAGDATSTSAGRGAGGGADGGRAGLQGRKATGSQQQSQVQAARGGRRGGQSQHHGRLQSEMAEVFDPLLAELLQAGGGGNGTMSHHRNGGQASGSRGGSSSSSSSTAPGTSDRDDGAGRRPLQPAAAAAAAATAATAEPTFSYQAPEVMPEGTAAEMEGVDDYGPYDICPPEYLGRGYGPGGAFASVKTLARGARPVAPPSAKRTLATAPAAAALPVATAATAKLVTGLPTGLVLLKGWLSIEIQAAVVAAIRTLGLGPGGFYTPSYADGSQLHLRMMCMGRHWEPRTSSYELARSAHDGASPPDMPPLLLDLVQASLEAAAAHTPATGGYKFSPFQPDICLANFYEKSGRLGMHQDKDETAASLRAGLPVVSFSIGDACDFVYGPTRDPDAPTSGSVRLDSGDVLIFGGPSRLIFHGVSKIHHSTAPDELIKVTGLRPGRLNLTFRQL